jgi:RNA polymerase sigma-70 factor (ECF subfamily)
MKPVLEDWVSKAQAGNKAAAEIIIEELYQPIYAFLFRLSGNASDAEDLTQKTFTKVWKSLQDYQMKSSFSTWVHGIAYHTYIDWVRSRKVPENKSQHWWESLNSDSCTLNEVTSREISASVYQKVESLDEPARSVIHLHYYQALSLSDTALALGVAVSTVKYRLKNAVESLQHDLANLKLSSY